MSSTFSANQYESAFRAQMQNRTHLCFQRPGARVGHTSFIADSKGHLLPGVKVRASNISSPYYKGTWDLPARIPVHPINPTARSTEGLRRLQVWGLCPEQGTNLHAGTRSADAGEQPVEGSWDEATEEVSGLSLWNMLPICVRRRLDLHLLDSF
uniref:Protein Flattop n=1 Tax=Nothobranchius furzeri TaxID=105023 RepID=A0A8C6NRA2_NOTFU